MFKVIFLVLILSQASCDTVTDKQCTCSQIHNETDCARIACKYENGTCKERAVESYCSLATVVAKCPVVGCALYESTCASFAGCTAYLGTTYDACQKISSVCTSDGERCVTLSSCDTYKSKTSCVISDTGVYCYYDTTNATTPVCKAATACANLPETLKTDKDCRAQIATCTVGDTGVGCVNSGKTCADQKTKLQCITNLDKTVICQWSDTTSKCTDFTCANGVGTTFDECQKYKKTCTLAESKTACQDFQDCLNYKSVDTCIKSTAGTCLWNDAATCVDKTCLAASDFYTNHSLCTSFLSTCTVDDDGLGCKDRADSCSAFAFRMQCIQDLAGNLCYWNVTQQKCVQYNCDNAEVDSYTADNCNKFLSTCTASSGNTKCISKACTDATTQSLCTKLNGCIWQTTVCSAYTCSSAPTSYATDDACNTYKSGCKTTGAGCSDTATCTTYKTSAACTSSTLATQCAWSNLACKVKACSDVTFQTFSECNTQLNTCSTDGIKCIAQPANCSLYKVQVSCIQAQDGPCVWVQGACYLFESCSSLPGQSHDFCQAASTKCTTDGTKCTAITSCAKNLQTGCYIGTDGECVRNINTKNETICEKFTKCTQMNFTTHYQCFREKSACTVSADKKTCTDLLPACTSYTIQDNCQVTTTGTTCQWDTPTLKCRDQVCTDILKTSYAECQAINPKCSTDSSKCIVMLKCEEYTTSATCLIGTDGKCLFDSLTNKCRLKLCSDITDVKQCTSLTNCLADTAKCVTKSKCASYTTETSCAFDGLDGICTWSGTACSIMTKCEDANSFEAACKKKSNVCKWTPKPSNGGASSCKAYTCQSKNSGSSCSPLISFDGTQYQVCADLQLTCQSASITDLTQETCFVNSAKTYYWDTVTTKCVTCNGTTTTNTTIVSVDQTILGIGVLLVAFLHY